MANSHRSLYALLLGGALLVAGCGGGAEKDAAGNDSLPPGSSAAEAGDHHHDDPADALAAHTHTTRLEFSSEPGEIPVGGPATLNLKIVDIKTGEPVKEFAEVHEKLLHLIIVSTDLTWFNHIHPVYKGDGLFTVTTSFPRAGSYKLYADYTPKDGEHEVAEHVFSTAGAPATPVTAQHVADTMQGAWMIKRVTSIPEGEPEFKGGDTYEVALMPMPAPVAGEDVMLHFQVRDKDGKPMTDVEPYLGAMGHAVILSGDASIYLHTHPDDGTMDHSAHGGGHGTPATGGTAAGETKPAAGDAKPAPLKPGGPDVMFHTNFPKPGLYKVWGQFQHKGKIITAPFVLNVPAAS